jgi:putative ABC transport system substrate-binding protein
LTPDVIVANSTPVIAALRASKTTTPIVFAMVNDPVGQGFIPSLAHPGSNISGFTFLDFAIIGKWVDMLYDVKPDLSRVTLMFNPDTSPYFDASVIQSIAKANFDRGTSGAHSKRRRSRFGSRRAWA